MRKIHIILLALILVPVCVVAQQSSDPVIFEINGQPIVKSEFMKEFLRSIGQSPEAAPTACTYEKRQKLEEYVNLFVNFRTKLTDAYAHGYDTSAQIIKELATYRKELAAPYLIDSATMQQIMDEAYERNRYVLHAAHILIPIIATDSPADTQAKYEMAMDAYRRATAGEDFFKLASNVNDQLTPPDQRLARQRPPQEGDLGCFSAFDMIYPFESAAYALEPGEVSLPIRTRYGYHVIKLFGKYEYYGNTTLRHIWVAGGNRPQKAKQLIDMAYARLQNGESFESVAKNCSDDAISNGKGGLLEDMAVGQLPAEYIEQLSQGLKPGEYSKPFTSFYGWHIIQLVKRDTMPPLDQLRSYYKQKLTHDPRRKNPEKKFILSCKSRYHFVDYTQSHGTLAAKEGAWVYTPAAKVTSKTPYAATLQPAVALLNDSVFMRRWVFDTTRITDNRPLFNLDGRDYTIKDFCTYIAHNQKNYNKCSMDKYASERYNDYIDHTILTYADSRLETENPDFRDIMRDYKQGLIIFAYNEEKIWNQAFLDTIGFRQFCDSSMAQRSEDNPDDEPYFWNARANVVVVDIADSSLIAPDKARKALEKAVRKQTSSSELRETMVKAAHFSSLPDTSIIVHDERVEDGRQTLLRDGEWKKGIFVHPNVRGYQLVAVTEVTPVMLKTVDEARGYYINDYQGAIEARLLQSLKKKYNVIVHQDVIDEITY